jgi:glycosyltransferase involved in cell wall biosynthesis
MRVAHVVFPRADAMRPVLDFVWDAIVALSHQPGIELEALIPVPIKALRFARGLRGAKAWPAELDDKLALLSPRPVLIPYLPLPKRSIESAAAAIAVHLLRRAASDRPRVLHGSLLDEGGFAAVDAARVVGSLSIAVAHGSDVRAAQGAFDPGRQRRALHTLRNATAILAVSHYLAGELAKLGARAEVLRYSTFADRFPLASRAPGRQVLFVGRISRDKGVDVLLEAIALLPADVELRLVGAIAGDLDPRVEAERLGIAERVRVDPEMPQAELAEVYAGGACTVLPSRHEGFGIVLVESLLVGRPVVGSDTGGIREIVRPDVGRLVPPGDPRALKRAIAEVLAARFDPTALRNAALPMTWDANGRALALFTSTLPTRPRAQPKSEQRDPAAGSSV